MKWHVLKKAPDSFDWREKGAVTLVRRQGPCRACWAFAIGGLLEFFHKMIYGILIELSVQYLIDCSDYHVNEPENNCLRGNDPNVALEFVQRKGIIESICIYFF